MKTGMDAARRKLQDLVDRDPLTKGMEVRAHGEHLILARGEEMDDGEMFLEDRIRLTRLSRTLWGLSVKRHTGRWERTPFQGTTEEMVDALCTFMQHLVAPY